jgi:protein-S-isoprenylcysteine O-methyltransferase Ste14
MEAFDMNQGTRVILTQVISLLTLPFIILTRGSLLGIKLPVVPLAFVLLAAGLLMVIWCIRWTPRGGGLDNVGPLDDTLRTEGPYRIVRHPYYLGAMLFYIGLAGVLKSGWGLLATFVLVIPLTLYRAKLEEEALQVEFGDEWQAYIKRTRFIIPWIY